MALRRHNTTARGRSRVFLVEDHPMMRDRVRQLVNEEADLMICGESGDATGALEAIEKTKPDLVITDLMLKDKHGLELIKDLQARHPRLAMLVLSMHADSHYATRALRAGREVTLARGRPRNT